jgi:opacity protein-like surface antigen
MPILKITAVAVAMAAGIGAASAATVQNSRGTFIQDRHGAWHQYVRVPQRRRLAAVYASADHGAWRQYYRAPQMRNSIGFNGRDEYDYGTAGQSVLVPQGRYSGGFYANEGYPVLPYVFGGQSYPYAGILSQH